MIDRVPPSSDRAVLRRWTVPEGPPVRLDELVRACLDVYPTRAGARKACERGEIAVDGLLSESSRWVNPGEEVSWIEPVGRLPKPLDRKIPVVWEDDWLAVVLKPAGLPTSGAHAQTLERTLPSNLRPSPLPDAMGVPRAVHRLDGQTSGLLIVAKSRSAHAALGQAFEQRTVTKRYRAIVVGRLEGEGSCDEEIDGRAARSRYVAVSHDRSLHADWSTTVDLVPETGRTHQLRRHLAALGHPVLGDTRYGQPGTILFGKGLFLFAQHVAFDHPVTGERIALTAEEPEKFAGYRRREAERWERRAGAPGTGDPSA